MFTDLMGQRRYKLGLHMHTTLSDGHMSPEAAVRLYKEAGYDAVALTDHWFFGEDRELEGMRILSGIEYNFGTDGTGDGVYHILSLMARRNPGVTREDTPQVCVDRILAAGGLPVLAHPAWSLNQPDAAANLRGVAFTEIFNTVSGEQASNRPYSGSFVDLSACRGKYYGLFASDDTHYYHCDECVAATMVKADSLSCEDIMAALLRGDYYATTGPEIHLTVEDGFWVVRCSPAVTVNIFSNTVWAAGRHNVGEDLTEIRVPLAPRDVYARAEVTDKNGRTAYSPILVLKP